MHPRLYITVVLSFIIILQYLLLHELQRRARASMPRVTWIIGEQIVKKPQK